jgi:hypothetical protein
MQDKRKDRLIILDKYLTDYIETEIKKLEKIPYKTEVQSELLKIFKLISEFQKLEVEFLTSLGKDMSEVESWAKYYKDKTRALYKL